MPSERTKERNPEFRIELDTLPYDWKKVQHADFDAQARSLESFIEEPVIMRMITHKHTKPVEKQAKASWTLKGNGSASEW